MKFFYLYLLIIIPLIGYTQEKKVIIDFEALTDNGRTRIDSVKCRNWKLEIVDNKTVLKLEESLFQSDTNLIISIFLERKMYSINFFKSHVSACYDLQKMQFVKSKQHFFYILDYCTPLNYSGPVMVRKLKKGKNLR